MVDFESFENYDKNNVHIHLLPMVLVDQCHEMELNDK